MDNYKGFTHLGAEHPDQAPRYGLLYLTVIPFFAAVGFVAWLGWDWPALVLTVLVVALVGGVMEVRRLSRRPGGRIGGDSAASHHRDARTSTLDSQKRMNLDSKGPLG